VARRESTPHQSTALKQHSPSSVSSPLPPAWKSSSVYSVPYQYCQVDLWLQPAYTPLNSPDVPKSPRENPMKLHLALYFDPTVRLSLGPQGDNAMAAASPAVYAYKHSWGRNRFAVLHHHLNCRILIKNLQRISQIQCLLFLYGYKMESCHKMYVDIGRAGISLIIVVFVHIISVAWVVMSTLFAPTYERKAQVLACLQ
jgi:hypothetical protein